MTQYMNWNKPGTDKNIVIDRTQEGDAGSYTFIN